MIVAKCSSRQSRSRPVAKGEVSVSFGMWPGADIIAKPIILWGFIRFARLILVPGYSDFERGSGGTMFYVALFKSSEGLPLSLSLCLSLTANTLEILSPGHSSRPKMS